MKLVQGMNCYKAKERDIKECAVGGKACLGALMPKARRNHSYECRAFFGYNYTIYTDLARIINCRNAVKGTFLNTSPLISVAYASITRCLRRIRYAQTVPKEMIHTVAINGTSHTACRFLLKAQHNRNV